MPIQMNMLASKNNELEIPEDTPTLTLTFINKLPVLPELPTQSGQLLIAYPSIKVIIHPKGYIKARDHDFL